MPCRKRLYARVFGGVHVMPMRSTKPGWLMWTLSTGLFTLLAVSACTSSTNSDGCARDSDCKGTRICKDESCVEANGAITAADGGSTSGGSTSGGSSTGGSSKLVPSSWALTGTDCKTGATFTQYVYTLCANGRIKGGGEGSTSVGRLVELQCGSYTIKPRTLENCDDKAGCFATVAASVRSTLGLGGEKDVKTISQELYYSESRDLVFRSVLCSDKTTGNIYLARIKNDTITNEDCTSDTAGICP
jgi:hypothetical protein